MFVDLPEDALKTLRDECTLLVGVLSWVGWKTSFRPSFWGVGKPYFHGALAVGFGEGRE